MKHRVGVALIGMVLLAAPVAASAASEWTTQATYSKQAAGKLKYGVTNVLLGWTALFREPIKAARAGENVFVGIGRGVWTAVGQTVGGAVHAVTFPVTAVDVPLPEGGTDVLK